MVQHSPLRFVVENSREVVTQENWKEKLMTFTDVFAEVWTLMTRIVVLLYHNCISYRDTFISCIYRFLTSSPRSRPGRNREQSLRIGGWRGLRLEVLIILILILILTPRCLLAVPRPVRSKPRRPGAGSLLQEQPHVRAAGLDQVIGSDINVDSFYAVFGL